MWETLLPCCTPERTAGVVTAMDEVAGEPGPPRPHGKNPVDGTSSRRHCEQYDHRATRAPWKQDPMDQAGTRHRHEVHGEHGDTYDRWTTWEGGPGGRGVTATVPSASIAYVIAPAQRRRGYATAMITAVMTMPELSHVELFGSGVEPESTASVGCLRKAGFRPLSPEPNWEGIVYYAVFRTGRDTPGKPA